MIYGVVPYSFAVALVVSIIGWFLSRPKPQRFTGQQRDMVRYIFSKHNHFDADHLIDDMKQAGLEVSRATVYRTLAKLVARDLQHERGIDAAGESNEAALQRANGQTLTGSARH